MTELARPRLIDSAASASARDLSSTLSVYKIELASSCAVSVRMELLRPCVSFAVLSARSAAHSAPMRALSSVPVRPRRPACSIRDVK